VKSSGCFGRINPDAKPVHCTLKARASKHTSEEFARFSTENETVGLCVTPKSKQVKPEVAAEVVNSALA